MSRKNIATALAITIPLIALLPLGLIVFDWARMSLVADASVAAPTYRSFDWVVWTEEEGLITADYVFPRGPAAKAGLQSGDVFYTLDLQQYFSSDILEDVVQGIKPGTQINYIVLRRAEHIEASVMLTRYPTFIYPISSGLWHFSLWGFTFAAFIHVLGVTVAAPLSIRTSRARLSLLLITVSGLWILGNLARLLLIQLVGPPEPATTYAKVFQILTLAGLVGWIGFPVLLVRATIIDAGIGAGPARNVVSGLVYAPAVVLAAGAAVAIVVGNIGPLAIDGLAAPILFYACCYIGLAAILALVRPDRGAAPAEGAKPRSTVGNAFMLAIAIFAALSIIGIVPILEGITNNTVGWLVVGTQLVSTIPVILVSLDTLRYGRLDRVFSRAATYLTILGLFFFAFVGGMSLLERTTAELGWPRQVVAGIFVVLLLLVFERIAMKARGYFAQFFATDRERAARLLDRFRERTPEFVDVEALTSQSIQVVGRAFNVRSAVAFIRTAESPERWQSASYHPEPPYLTERVVRILWPHFQNEGKVWAFNPEVNASALPDNHANELISRGAVLAIPIRGKDKPTGLLVLGRKRERRAVYNIEDVDRLRSFAGHLALAIERLRLVEREKELVRESSLAQLRALRAQINPHFLFNALNTIAASIDERPDEAEATVEDLAAIFRYILQTGDKPFVALRDELSLVHNYLNIERARFGEKLEVQIDTDDELLDEPVPAFAIQTVVENAVKHGLEKVRHGGRVHITCSRSNGHLDIEVADTGVGIPALFGMANADDQNDSFYGIGLRNISTRLEHLYGRNDLLKIRSAAEVGTTVTIRIPESRDPVELSEAPHRKH